MSWASKLLWSFDVRQPFWWEGETSLYVNCRLFEYLRQCMAFIKAVGVSSWKRAVVLRNPVYVWGYIWNAVLNTMCWISKSKVLYTKDVFHVFVHPSQSCILWHLGARPGLALCTLTHDCENIRIYSSLHLHCETLSYSVLGVYCGGIFHEVLWILAAVL